MIIKKYADIIYKIYTGSENEFTKDFTQLASCWNDFLLLFLYDKYNIISTVEAYFSNIFVTVLNMLNTQCIYNLLKIMSFVSEKINNFTHISFIAANEQIQLTEQEIKKIYTDKYHSVQNIIIHKEVSDNLVGGWILIDEQCNLINRSFGFLNFIK